MNEQILELQQISKHYGAKAILDNISLIVNRKDRIALVGENGTGKTTLAKIIMGIVEPDEGRVLRSVGIEVGYLPQEAEIEDDSTVQGFIERSLARLDQLRTRLTQLETDMSALGLSATQLDSLLADYGPLQEEFTNLGGYELDHRIDQVLSGLDLNYIPKGQVVQTLSGGEKTRLMLASLLLCEPQLLVLDEPTNHLDFAAVAWLEEYLLTYTGSIFVISHDRRFLNRVITQIAELSPASHQITLYHGNYDYFMAERERLQAKIQQAYEEQQEEIKTLQRLIKTTTHNSGNGRPRPDNDKFAKGFFRGRVEKSQSREISMAKKRLEVLEDNPAERPIRKWQISPDFNPAELSSRDVISLWDVSKSYDTHQLLCDVTMTIHGGDHVVFQGPNGIGKTTLLKLILGLQTPDRGTIRIAAGARIGYLDQEQETLDPAQTVLECFSEGLQGSEAEYRSNLHKYGLFGSDQVLQRVGSLSQGQKRKLQLARLIVQKANVLLLDEPTNHLDLDSVEQFEEALNEFPGTILAVSHDRTFIERVGRIIWTLQDGQIIESVDPK